MEHEESNLTNKKEKATDRVMWVWRVVVGGRGRESEKERVDKFCEHDGHMVGSHLL